MKKRVFAAVTLLAMLLFGGCKRTEPISEPTSDAPKIDLTSTSAENSFEVNPPFFKVENAETGAVVYMLGSMHVGKAEATYPQKISDALDECETLAVEVDVQAFQENYAEMTEAVTILLCENGKTARDYMGDDYDKIVKAFTEKGLYNQIYDSYIPAFWSSLWSNDMAAKCGYDGNLGTDMLLLSYAKERGKKIDEIETAKEQYEVEASCSAELQMLTLNQTIELSKEETQEQFDALYNTWKSGDINALKALATEEEDGSMSEKLKKDYEQYYDAMYSNRQKKMAEYVMNKLTTGGKTFVVVGAMHYAAPPSILDILEENGCKVETLN